MPEALDLTEVNSQLDGLVSDLSGRGIVDLLREAGDIFADAWKANVTSAGLIESGRYHDSIETVVLGVTDTKVLVSVQTDARNNGVPYPAIIEYGDAAHTHSVRGERLRPGTGSVHREPHPVAMRAFDANRRKVIAGIEAGLDRKIKARARRAKTGVEIDRRIARGRFGR